MLVGRAGLSPAMVGRSVELDRLVSSIGSGSTPTVALVAGEAGIGKTRLVQELVAAAPGGTVVVAGQADPETAGRPFALFLDALRPTRPASGTEPSGGAAPSGGSTAGEGADQSRPSEEARLEALVYDCSVPAEEAIEAAVALVQLRIRGAAGLLVFEDLHWADAESLAIFERLAEPASGPLLLVGTYRPDGLSRRHPASALIPRLDRRHSVAHFHLERLSLDEAGVFLHAVYGEAPSLRATYALHTRTGGNPFFLEELIAASPSAPNDDGDEAPLPWTVSELVRAQFDELEPDVRSIVAAAAELGRRVSFDVLAAVTETAEAELIPLLRAAVDEGLLVETEPDVFGFHHEIAREAIAGGLLGPGRRRLHQTALDALRAAGNPDHAARARHALGAGRFDQMVEEARLGAHEALARGSSYQALQLAELGLGEAEDDIDLVSVAARAGQLARLIDDAVANCEQWLALARARDDTSEEAAALALRMRLAHEASDRDLMATVTSELAALVDRLSTDAERARAMAYIAQSYMLRTEVATAIEWADKAYELADRNQITDVRVAAQVEHGSALILNAGTRSQGAAALRAAVEAAERAGEHVLAARAIHNLVFHWLSRENAREMQALVEKMRLHEKAAGWKSLDYADALALIAAAEGDLDQAIAHLAEQPGAQQLSPHRLRFERAIGQAGFALEAGDLDTATRLTEQAMPDTSHRLAAVHGLELHLAARRGDVEAVRLKLPQVLSAIDTEPYVEPSLAHDLIAAGLTAGLRPDELRPIIDHIAAHPRNRLSDDDPWWQLCHAQLAEAEGRTEQAVELYLAAAKGLGSSPGGLAGHLGTAHVRAAKLLTALGRLDEARAHAAEAETCLARWRGWRVEELRAVERRLGIGDEPTGPALLTRREREVAALLTEGITNSTIASRLYISPRTAAVHVSNILAKLGMSSRAEVAAWAAAGGLDEAAE